MKLLLPKQQLLYAYFLAEEFSQDTKTKVGCIIVDEKGKALSIGVNDFPKGLQFKPDCFSEEKNNYIIHAEQNAIINLCGKKFKAKSLSIYVTHAPCAVCCRMIAALSDCLNIPVEVFYHTILSKSEPSLLDILGIKHTHIECLHIPKN